MRARNIAVVALLVIGATGLGYGADETQLADVGRIPWSIDEKESVNVPVWAGAGGIVLMLVCRRKS